MNYDPDTTIIPTSYAASPSDESRALAAEAAELVKRYKSAVGHMRDAYATARKARKAFVVRAGSALLLPALRVAVAGTEALAVGAALSAKAYIGAARGIAPIFSKQELGEVCDMVESAVDKAAERTPRAWGDDEAE